LIIVPSRNGSLRGLVEMYRKCKVKNGAMVAICGTLIIMLSFFGGTLLTEPAITAIQRKDVSFGATEKKEKISQKALKDCYIVPGKGPPEKLVV
jgi:TM2 domain-containing membrane protein YozV